jgi:(1->4)-alpha-D-glucan 1-alpha-D-glucosylmutase
MGTPSSPPPWIATYRLQLHKNFTLGDAEKILPYLAELGISHVYLSPCLQATPGSQHGYDVTNTACISEDLGGEPAWTTFVAAIRAHQLGILLDIVPNHMAATSDNLWWEDVLTKGPFSPYAHFFDVQLSPTEPFCLHLSSLGKPYGDALDAGELTFSASRHGMRVHHFDNSWPLSAESWGRVLCSEAPTFESLATLRNVLLPTDQDKIEFKRLNDDALSLLREADSSGNLKQAVDRINANPRELDIALNYQFYQLHGWKLAGELTNFRRFFDVSTLIGMTADYSDVFDATHARFKAMIAQRDIAGLRIDHPDGLRDPRQYFERLRTLLPKGRIYIEKILDNDEQMPPEWRIDGSVGYDFLAKVNRLWMSDQFVDRLTATYADFTEHPVNLAALIREKKDYIFGFLFAFAHARLASMATQIARSSSHTRDLSPRQIRDALAQITAALGVYRTYRTAESLSDTDKRVLTDAVSTARFSKALVEPATYDFWLDLLTRVPLTEAEAALVSDWQQLTPAVMAKGVEDTTFYCFDRLLSCNEVGAQASLVGISADKFHEYCHSLGEQWPNNQLATSTHDNKRSEDVRTRISLLSEIPDRWARALHVWSGLNEEAWNKRNPDRHAEYLLYQTLIGAWPIEADRAWAYMLKASREAKMRTSWQEPNASYESNIQGFVERVLRNEEFRNSLTAFVEPLIRPGRINSMAQTLIKLIVPGLPDFYQGTELWDLSLVDPDNRRAVDYDARRVLLARGRHLTAAQVMEDWEAGLPKIWLIDRVLSLRAANPKDFAPDSKYQPLVAQGVHLGNMLAFRRGDNLIAVVPRLTLSMGEDWGDTRLPLPSGAWTNVFTDQKHEAVVAPAQLFDNFPVALLKKHSRHLSD